MGLFGDTLTPITVGYAERHDLLVLAMSGTSHTADQADDLLFELGRAAIVDDRHVPADVVRMGSIVTARIDGGAPRHLRLSYPQETGPGDLSILSVVGTALLGLRAGRSMKWTDRDGRGRRVEVLSVSNTTS